MTTSLSLESRGGLPDALRVLLEAYPRATWDAHPHFGDLVRFWMQRHAMFRDLLRRLSEDAEARLAGTLAPEEHLPRVGHLAGFLLNELHGHHQIEDHHYFPRLMTLDPRIARGFDLLEADHDAMDGLLHEMAGAATAVLKGGSVAPFRDRLDRFSTLLERHLTDEEEIVVPVILKSGFRG